MLTQTGTKLVLASSLLAVASANDIVLTVFGIDTCDQGDCSITRIDNAPNSLAAGNEFASRLSNPVVENFENLDDKTPAPFTLTNDTLSMEVTGNDAVTRKIYNENAANGGRYPTDQNTYLQGQSDNSMKFKFSEQMEGFGFFGTDIGDEGGKILLRTFTRDEEHHDFEIPIDMAQDLDGNKSFFGFIDTVKPFMSVAVMNMDGGKLDVFGIDQIIYATSGSGSGQRQTGNSGGQGCRGGLLGRRCRGGTRGGSGGRTGSSNGKFGDVDDQRRDNEPIEFEVTDLTDDPEFQDSDSSDSNDGTQRDGGSGGNSGGNSRNSGGGQNDKPRNKSVFNP